MECPFTAELRHKTGSRKNYVDFTKECVHFVSAFVHSPDVTTIEAVSKNDVNFQRAGHCLGHCTARRKDFWRHCFKLYRENERLYLRGQTLALSPPQVTDRNLTDVARTPDKRERSGNSRTFCAVAQLQEVCTPERRVRMQQA